MTVCVDCAGKGVAMVSLTEALAAEREKLQQDSADTQARREVGREVQEALFERLAGKPLLGWSFVLGNDVIVVSHAKVGSIVSWIVDPEEQLKAGTNVRRFPEKTG